MIRLQTAGHVAQGARPYTPGPPPTEVMAPVPAPLEIGSSGLITTAADLARWVRTLADGAYPELFVEDDPLGSIDAGSDGQGAYVAVQGTLPGYSANAIAWRDTTSPSAISATCSITRSCDSPARCGPCWAIIPLRRQQHGPVPCTGLRHRALAGRYTHPDFGPIAIADRPERGGMTLTMPGKPAYWSFYLTPIADGGLLGGLSVWCFAAMARAACSPRRWKATRASRRCRCWPPSKRKPTEFFRERSGPAAALFRCPLQPPHHHRISPLACAPRRVGRVGHRRPCAPERPVLTAGVSRLASTSR